MSEKKEVSGGTDKQFMNLLNSLGVTVMVY